MVFKAKNHVPESLKQTLASLLKLSRASSPTSFFSPPLIYSFKAGQNYYPRLFIHLKRVCDLGYVESKSIAPNGSNRPSTVVGYRIKEDKIEEVRRLLSH